MKEPALVLFDIDGTVFDSQNLIIGGFEAAFAMIHETPPPRAVILQQVGLSLDQAIAGMRPDFDAEKIVALREAYRQSFQKSDKGAVPFYPGMRRLLGALSESPHLWVGAATGKSRIGLDKLLEAHGLSAVFFTKQTADFHPSKPAPAMIHAALEETGIDAAQCVMIGDTSYDIEMGKNAGARTIGVRWGYHGERLHESAPDVMAQSAADIYQTLRNWGML